MKAYLLILPIFVLVTYSQLIVKWRSNATNHFTTSSFLQHLMKFLTDPAFLSAYAAALNTSYVWLYVVTRLPLTVTKLAAVLLIMYGIVPGVGADA